MGEVRQFPIHRARLPMEASYSQALSLLEDAAELLIEEGQQSCGYRHLVPLLTRLLVKVHGADGAADILDTAVMLAEALGRRGPAA